MVYFDEKFHSYKHEKIYLLYRIKVVGVIKAPRAFLWVFIFNTYINNKGVIRIAQSKTANESHTDRLNFRLLSLPMKENSE